jgi:hypothetical protein
VSVRERSAEWVKRMPLMWRLWVLVGAAVALRLSAWLAAGLTRLALRAARWWLLFLTLRLWASCADCHTYIHAHARICHRCGYRRA